MAALTGPAPRPAPRRPVRGPARRPVPRRGGGFGGGIRAGVGYLMVIWAVWLANVLFLGGALLDLGVQPRDTAGLWHVLTAPWIHVNAAHLISNSVPGAVLSFLIGVTGRRALREVTLIVILVGGLGIWFLGAPGSVHVGASILVYGWFSYLVVRGIFNRSPAQIILGLAVGAAYAGLVWGLLPGTPGVSWEGHLFGALGGVLAAMTITSDDPVRRLGPARR